VGFIECGHLRPVKCNIIIHLNKDDKMKDVSGHTIKTKRPSTLRIVSVILAGLSVLIGSGSSIIITISII